MKATGIVRRIDDLGRVVMPKEIRRTMRIREGDPLEIYTNSDGEIIFKKYSPIGELSSFSAQYAEALNKVGGLPAMICDRDHVVAVAGIPKKEMMERRLSTEMENALEHRKTVIMSEEEEKIKPVDGNERHIAVSCPILAAGDVTGAVMFVSADDKKVDEAQVKLIQAAALFLGKQMEA